MGAASSRPRARAAARRRPPGALVAFVLALAPAAAARPTFVPVPEIIIDPNEGNTLGLMLATLFKDEQGDVHYLFAPDIRYNKTKGVYPVLRFLAYPSEDRSYAFVVGKSTTRDEDYEARYKNYELLDGDAFLEGQVFYERDSTERFWGFGNDSKEDEESNYTSAIFVAEGRPGYYFLPNLSISWVTRLLHHDTQPGQVDDIPFIAVEHPDVRGRGLDAAWYWTNGLSLTYDTRDSRAITREGTYAELYVAAADRALGSATSFVKFGIEGREFIPFREAKNPVLAMRARLDWITGDGDTPFYELNSVGGKRSLRGYGSDRFVDFNRSVVSAELRTRVWSPRILGVDIDIELAPFLETGEVFHSLGESPVGDLHWVVGQGFRGIIRPQIVAFVDLGYGGEGLAIFTGVDYPF